jgi:AcrR family transcriptional regulator
MDEETSPPRPRRAVADLTSRRANQKARTYRAVVEAAVTFVREGRDFSIADVADAARVGRTTAYNYFPSKESLLAQAVSEVVIRADFAELSAFFRQAQSSDVETRVNAIVDASHASIIAHEAEYRTFLRISLDTDRRTDREDEPPPRPTFRAKRLAEALTPLGDKLDPAVLQRLVAALSLCVGIEAHIALLDVCGLSTEEAGEVKRWAAAALLKAGLSELDARQAD